LYLTKTNKKMKKLLTSGFLIVSGIGCAITLQHLNCQTIETNWIVEWSIYTFLSVSCFGTYLFTKSI
jgi:hypothetical protein